ncbi:HDOD domain-containing protein [Litorilituus lipolyticus]|uniref:HDOD domain-containing protein n=2 Tax=Litorilituus lipolyticus TaxID=2491017 RepID=A0A502L8S2_9GAMM|nr:HDOD domain-containing protein [Litorilituus lipolyticus]
MSMLFNILVVLIIIVVAVLFLTRKDKRQSKHQYSHMVDEAKINAKKKTTHKPINAEFVDAKPEESISKTKVKSEAPEDFLAFQVKTSDKLTNEQRQVITEITQSFRKPHPLLLPLTQRSFEPNELFELIKKDTEMTAKVLNAVNSPLFALHQPITNINHAIIYLGVGQVKSIAMQFAMQQGMKFTDKNQNEAYQKLWKASYLASSFCALVAQEMGEENPAELSTRCLLSYLGDLAILSYKPSMAGFYLDDFTLFERTKVFQESMGVNAAIVGKYLANQWQLPNVIESGIDHSILPLTNGKVINDLSHNETRHLLLCYLSCRLGDLVSFNGLTDVPDYDEVSYEALGELEFYYTQENIELAGVNKINAVIADQAFKKKLNKIIAKVNADI